MIKSFEGEFEFLSNFHPSEIVWCGISFPTVEHAFQASKGEVEGMARFAALPTPGKAKREGQKLTKPESWEIAKVPVMLTLLRRKFQIPELREKLLATGNKALIEGNNWHDTFWGVCTCPNCEWGKNVLGELLMQVREEIR
jgi:ribA/ribD-fused uncharacterized protein